MTTKEKPAPLTLETLVALAIRYGASADDARLKWRLRRGYSMPNNVETPWVLESQDTSHSSFHSNSKRVEVTNELRDQLLVIFPQPSEANHWDWDLNRKWFTLQGICKRLGETGVGAQIEAAKRAAKQAEADYKLRVAQNALSDWRHAASRAVEAHERGPAAMQDPAVLTQLEHLAAQLNALASILPYWPSLTAGAAVRVPGEPGDAYAYEGRAGVVLKADGRTITVDVKQRDGSAVVKIFDVSDVREAR